LVHSVRGPRGGFQLRPDGDGPSLLDVYETLEGPLDEDHCVLGSTPLCRRDRCRLGGVSRALLMQFKTRFADTRLSDLTPTFRSET
jgi:DNA-binding IscR family transcriptional regulator